jgi:hypothetical protein
MPQAVFLLEERSMKTFLEALIPRYWPELDFRCIAHEGKQDLEKSILAVKAKFRQPDQIQQPSKILKRLVRDFQKISGARAMAAHLTRETNNSESFHATMSAIDRLAQS